MKRKEQTNKKERYPNKRGREEAKPTAVSEAAKASDAKEVPSNKQKDTAPQLKQYACLGEECESLFPMWQKARKHMQECNKFESDKKPNMKESAAKAQQVLTSKPELKAELEAELLANPTPWENVTEDELVQVVRAYYDKVGWDNVKSKKDVIAGAIRPKYGDFPFGKFGFGSFREWSTKHGLSVTEKKAVTDKKVDDEKADDKKAEEEE